MKPIKKKHAWLIISAVVVVLGMIDFAVYIQKKDDLEIINRRKAENREEARLNNLVDKVLANIKEINADDPKNWKVYREEKFGVQFNYPSYYQIHKAPNFIAEQSKNYEVFVTLAHFDDELVPRVTFVVTKEAIGEVLRGYFGDLKEAPIVEERSGFTQYKMINLTDDNKLDDTIIIDDTNARYVFYGSEVEVIDKIVSTFKVEKK